MVEVEQQAPQSPPNKPKKRSILRGVLFSLLFILIALIVAVAVMVSTDKGSKFLLDRVLSKQSMIQYQYESGNIVQGIILNHVLINLTDLEVKVGRADVSLGWRAILNREIHLRRADISNLQIINHAPPSNEPFKFAEIKLPFILRLDKVDLDRLEIKSDSSSFAIKDIHVEDALWEGTRLSFKNTQLDMDFLSVRDAKGEMKFEAKYPLNATAVVNIPALESLNIKDIYLNARGSLDEIQAGIATKTPDLLTAKAKINPMRPDVPMSGALFFKDYHWPLLLEQELLSTKGQATFSGNVKALQLALDTDISGKNIPQGQYTASMSTDLIEQLNIQSLNGRLMDGEINLNGLVNWKDHVAWDIKGRLDQISPKDKIIPQMVRDFLPPSLDAKIGSQGELKAGMKVVANVDFDRYESWALTLNQKETLPAKPEPMHLDVSWKNIDRAMPYVGWLSSDTGTVNLVMDDKQQDIQVATQIRPHEKGTVPAGQYKAQLNVKGDTLNVPMLSYQAAKGSLTGNAVVELPTEKRQLKWQALLNANDFNPQTVTKDAPVDLLNGSIKANGYALPNAQVLQFTAIDLMGRLAGQPKPETVKLAGHSNVTLSFHDEKAGGAFKAFAVNYDGSLNASQFPQGDGKLRFKLAGTPQFINIDYLEHNGIAGNISANGQVNLTQGVAWNVNAAMQRFKPHYFVSSLRGEVSGQVKSQGQWSDKMKRVSVENLNLAGTINNKVLRGQGNLAMVLNSTESGFMPQQFEANDLFISYARNQIQATGNAQNLRLKVDAPALNELYNGLRGRAYGYLNLQAKPRLSATANLIVDNFAFNDIRVKKISVIGELPTSDTVASSIKAQLDTLRAGDREIQYAAVTLSGTRKAHLLQLQGWNYYSKFYVQFAGGFNAQNDWLGQVQKGEFDSVRAHLLQNQNAPIIFNSAKSELYVGQHCWSSKDSKLCFDQPIHVSQAKGNLSFVTNNLDLKDFAAFMPEGLAMTGKLNGYAKASWAQGAKPKIDARLVTRNGEIGLAAADPDDAASTMNYDEASFIAKSINDKLLLRMDLKAPNIGTGYANVVVNPYAENKTMNGEVAFNEVQLKILKPFIADVRSMDGTLSLAGKIGGTLTQPVFDGEMRLKNGAISMISLPVNLTNLQVYSSIRQNSASINGAFNSGSGVGLLTGNIDWKNDPRINLHLKGDKLVIRQAPLVTAVVDTDIEVEALPMSKRLTVNGKIEIPRALISMPEPSATVVNVSPDVRIVKQGQDQLALLKEAKPWAIRADVSVALGKQVIFQGFNSRIPLIGRLNLSQRGLETAMRANGAIGVSQKVTIEAYGQNLDLTRAIARFNGPLENPTLDVETRKSVSGSTVGIRVTGTASSPSIQVFNDAGLSEQEALNALITGRINEGSSGLSNTEGFKSDVNNTIAAAGISLGLGGTRAFTNQIGRTFGLSGLALDAQGTGNDTQVSLTGYITPDLYIRYGVGVFTPVNKLTLRYQMNKRLYLEASESVEKAIDIFYHWRF
ncbi:autotransporter secretion inner membrane protein TamB [Acinetobacter calcoaceticus]|uniref:Autotransporter secretion inner membrane protein TamB n=1 Tax=Acinetobacter calcoaceticus TaxID=471 RepID=A0A4R1XQG7_ACICA|nr:autotransporter secretion inner membrane protein TamB [Acinetobacter calcoaceticus]